MPQRTARRSLLTNLHHQATAGLAAMTKEIRQREQELATLKAEAARWQNVLREPAEEERPTAPAPRRRATRRRRLDWNVILKALPARFTTKDIAQKTGKPMAHAYTWRCQLIEDNATPGGEGGDRLSAGAMRPGPDWRPLARFGIGSGALGDRWAR
jgi:hypothetical protein